MKLTNSRRLTGPSLFLEGPGVAIDIQGDGDLAQAAEAWKKAARDLLDRLGWSDSELVVWPYEGGATLVFSAPEDALYAGCEVNEAAWEAAAEKIAVTDEIAEQLKSAIAAEQDPKRRALAQAADQHRVRFLADDERLSLGSGAGCQVWPLGSLPNPDEVDWERIHDVPVALITGTNGKTTTARMLSRIAIAAGLTPGNTSTDGVQIGGKTILEGDYTGGEGARAVLQNNQVDIAFLENARGGMLRRGLAIERAEAAYVTNIGTDHLGEYGINDLVGLAKVKLLVAKAVAAQGTFVVNVDDPYLAAARGKETLFVSLAGEGSPAVGLSRGFIRKFGRLGEMTECGFVPWIEAAEIPATLGGAAEHNIANALGAMAIADALGLPLRAIVDGLAAFSSDPFSNPGRANLFDFGGLRAVLDFAHNPEGIEAALIMAAKLRPKRVLMLLGQAGDRDDESVAELCRVCANHNPDRVIVKDMPRHQRGRAPGEMVDLIVRELSNAGLPESRIATAKNEMAAVRQALAWGRPGDLLLLLVLSERTTVLDRLVELQSTGWHPGQELPVE